MGHGDTDRVVTACNGLVGQPVPLGAQDDRQALDGLELWVVDGDGGVAQGHGRRLEAQVVQTAQTRLRPLGVVLTQPGPGDLKDRPHAHPDGPPVQRVTAGGGE